MGNGGFEGEYPCDSCQFASRNRCEEVMLKEDTQEKLEKMQTDHNQISKELKDLRKRVKGKLEKGELKALMKELMENDEIRALKGRIETLGKQRKEWHEKKVVKNRQYFKDRAKEVCELIINEGYDPSELDDKKRNHFVKLLFVHLPKPEIAFIQTELAMVMYDERAKEREEKKLVKTKEMQRVNELMNSDKSVKEQIQLFIEEFGKTERTYYKLKKQLKAELI